MKMISFSFFILTIWIFVLTFTYCKLKDDYNTSQAEVEKMELETQIEKMKCCANCDFIFRDGNCYYDKECKNKDHWKLRR